MERLFTVLLACRIVFHQEAEFFNNLPASVCVWQWHDVFIIKGTRSPHCTRTWKHKLLLWCLNVHHYNGDPWQRSVLILCSRCWGSGRLPALVSKEGKCGRQGNGSKRSRCSKQQQVPHFRITERFGFGGIFRIILIPQVSAFLFSDSELL